MLFHAQRVHGRRLRILLLAVVFLGAAALGACNGDEGAPPTASPTPTATAGATQTATPGGTEPAATATATATPTPTSVAGEPRRTGDADLDAIIAAVEERDLGALSGLIEYQELGCTTAQGLGGPPKCEPGQPEGEVMRVFPTGACEGSWTRFGVAELGLFVQRAEGLWAALEFVRYPEAITEWPEPDVALVFHSSTASDQDIATYLEVTDGRITRTALVCFGGLEDLLAAAAFEFEVIAGPFEDPLTAEPVEPPSTGIAAVDEVLAYVATYDAVALREDALAAMQSGEPVACVEVEQGPGAVPCDAKNGETAGDLVPVFPMAFCEGAYARDPGPPLQGFLNGAPRLHAVVEAPAEPSPSPVYRHGAYWLVCEFESQEPGAPAARLQLLEDGGIAVMWYGCGPSAEELAAYEGEALPVVLEGQ